MNPAVSRATSDGLCQRSWIFINDRESLSKVIIIIVFFKNVHFFHTKLGLDVCPYEVKNALIRVICSLGPRDSVSGARRDLHWLPIEQQIIFKIAVLTFNCRRRPAPPYLCDLVHDYLPRRTLRSGDGVTLEVPRTKTMTAERAFSVAAPTIWNALPLKLRQSKHFSGFKTELKTHLFTKC